MMAKSLSLRYKDGKNEKKRVFCLENRTEKKMKCFYVLTFDTGEESEVVRRRESVQLHQRLPAEHVSARTHPRQEKTLHRAPSAHCNGPQSDGSRRDGDTGASSHSVCSCGPCCQHRGRRLWRIFGNGGYWQVRKK